MEEKQGSVAMTAWRIRIIGLTCGAMLGGLIAFVTWMNSPSTETPHSVGPWKTTHHLVNSLSFYESRMRERVMYESARNQVLLGDTEGVLEVLRKFEGDSRKVALIAGLLGTEETLMSSGPGMLQVQNDIVNDAQVLQKLKETLLSIKDKHSIRTDNSTKEASRGNLLREIGLCLLTIGKRLVPQDKEEAKAAFREALLCAVESGNTFESGRNSLEHETLRGGARLVADQIAPELNGDIPINRPLWLWPLVFGVAGFILVELVRPVIKAWSQSTLVPLVVGTAKDEEP